jgi:xanthine/CO dehydrogenase XdhC/CoxF family maturation factor
LDIAAVSPQEVALAILAEVVAFRRGGTGLPLSAWRRSNPN